MRPAAKSHARKVAPHRVAECVVCGDSFVALRAPNLRWPRTCSLSCQVTSIDNFIAALSKRRETLLERIDRGGA